MKKLLYLALLAVAVCFTVASCSDDADQRRVYIENNTSDTLVLYLQSGERYSDVHTDFNTVFPPSKLVEMPFFVHINDLPSSTFDQDHEKVMFKTNKGRTVKKDYHNGNSFVYGKKNDVEGYFFVVEDSDLE